MDQQQDITDFQSRFNGPFPFTSDGVLVGSPVGQLRGGDADDDHLRRAGRSTSAPSTTRTCTSGGATTSPRRNFNLTFFKEGMATVGRVPLRAPAPPQTAAGGPGTAAGRRGVPAEPGRPVQHQLRQHRASGPPPRPTRRRPPCSPAAPPTPGRARRTSPCARSSATTASTARCSGSSTLRRRQHHRAAARGAVRPLPAAPQPGVPGPARPVLHPVVRHGLPAGRRRQPPAAHRPRAWHGPGFYGGRLPPLTGRQPFANRRAPSVTCTTDPLCAKGRAFDDQDQSHRRRGAGLRRRRAADAAGAVPPREAREDRHRDRLRHQQLRRLHRAPRRPQREVAATCWRSRPTAHEVTTIEGLAQRRRAASGAGGVPRVPRPPVRLLHAGDDHAGVDLLNDNPHPTEEEIRRRARGQPLPVHRLPQHRQGGPVRRGARRRAEPEAGAA